MSVVEENEEFSWNNISIRQENNVFKVGTDALLLGAWIPGIIKAPNSILDAGTGTGILALMMAYFFHDARITAVDEEEAAVRLARLNFQNSAWPERLFIQQENILESTVPDVEQFDLILCNPPFYFDQLQSPSGHKTRAKHAAASSLFWMEALIRKLKTSGHVCIVVPYEMTADWISSANASGFYCQHRMDIYSFTEDLYPKRSLLHFHANLIKPELSRLCIHEDETTYTEAYLTFSGIRKKQRHVAKSNQGPLRSLDESKEEK